MKKKDTFKIGKLSKLFDIGVDSIRYYEKVGILHPVRMMRTITECTP